MTPGDTGFSAALRDFLDMHDLRLQVRPIGQELRAALLNADGRRVAGDYGATLELAIAAAVAAYRKDKR